MTKRGLVALLFAVVVFIEILYFVNQDDPKKITDTGKGGFFSSVLTTDRDEQNAQNTKFAIILIATLVVGGIVTFSMRNEKLENTNVDTSSKTKE